jgi:hypothetical protein
MGYIIGPLPVERRGACGSGIRAKRGKICKKDIATWTFGDYHNNLGEIS